MAKAEENVVDPSPSSNDVFGLQVDVKDWLSYDGTIGAVCGG
jgi:hypothetical protein